MSDRLLGKNFDNIVAIEDLSTVIQSEKIPLALS
jgi:hypothetical protein